MLSNLTLAIGGNATSGYRWALVHPDGRLYKESDEVFVDSSRAVLSGYLAAGRNSIISSEQYLTYVSSAKWRKAQLQSNKHLTNRDLLAEIEQMPRKPKHVYFPKNKSSAMKKAKAFASGPNISADAPF